MILITLVRLNDPNAHWSIRTVLGDPDFLAADVGAAVGQKSHFIQIGHILWLGQIQRNTGQPFGEQIRIKKFKLVGLELTALHKR